MKNLFFLTDIGFSKRDYERFSIKILQKFYNIYVVDLMCLNQKLFKLNIYKDSIFKIRKYIKIKSVQHFFDFELKNNCDYAIDLINTRNNKTYYFKNLLKRKRIKLVYFSFGLVPPNCRTLAENSLRILGLMLSPFKFLKKIFLVLNNKINNFKFKKLQADIMLISGKAKLENYNLKNTKKIIFSHSLDYENFLKTKIKKNFIKKKYYVFLDQYLPFHPATYYRNEPHLVTAEKYFSSLNKFFSMLEKKLKIKVVIAAHPRANLKNYNFYFNNRYVSYAHTLQLVNYASGVLAHTTTAISYAIILKKPIIFLTTNEIIKSFDDYRVHSNARLLNSTLINIDDNKDLIYEQLQKKNIRVDLKKYKSYFDNYIKHPKSQNISFIDIFRRNLN